MAWMMTASMWLTGVSIVLLLILLVLYIRNLRQVKSNLLIGLMIFTAIFLIQNVCSAYYYVTMMDYYVQAVETHVFILTALQTIAFAVMLKITLD